MSIYLSVETQTLQTKETSLRTVGCDLDLRVLPEFTSRISDGVEWFEEMHVSYSDIKGI